MIRLRCFAAGSVLLLAHLIFCCITAVKGSSAARLPDDEVEALRQIGKTLLKRDWDFDVDPCSGESGWSTPYLSKDITNNVSCDCSYDDSSVCHVTHIELKSQSLSGSLPPAMARLPYLQVIDLSRNYLNGTIPVEWANLPLTKLALLGNRLSGDIPPWIGNLTALSELVLEANHFTGQLPVELAKLFNINTMQLSSNKFTGNLPSDLANLTKIEYFMINDNSFSGKIPEWIQNWTNLKRLELQASGFEGPIPSGIFSLMNLNDLRVSDVKGTMSFPQLTNSKNLKRLILRNCGLSGDIPDYIGNLKLKQLDLSFNNLTGTIPTTLQNLTYSAKFMFLNRNKLSGLVQDWMFNSTDIDLSYNNLTWTGHDPSCQQVKLNLVGNSYKADKLSSTSPCLEFIPCNSCQSSLHINCGGGRFPMDKVVFEEDTDSASASKFFLSANKNWAFSSTGNYLDDNDDDDKYIALAESSLRLSMADSGLYDKARISPISLTYYGLCLAEGNYTVKLHFAEIIITSDEEYSSVGERIFDVYIQGNLVLKNFNIRDEANGSGIAIQKLFYVTVTGGKLEIHLYWAGKGTQVIPKRGTYGPLISAISVESNFQKNSAKLTKVLVVIITSVSFLIFLLVGILWKKGCFGGNTTKDRELKVLDLKTGRFTLEQIKMATDNFSTSNKIGEGGFGPVYKGLLSDGTIVAVKQLSSKSKQGNREFLNEIGMISALQHPNLVKLHGCCIEGNQLLLVYEYMENNSLARALFGSEEHQLKLDWATRINICVGIAKGLAYLHEESRLKVVHRDIKSTNILLDKDLNAKISDFGLARLDEEENSHISTRIAGTIGYMAPEYATRGYLTEKADVYSFGIVVLEIVSGRSVTSYVRDGDMHLLDWVQILREEGNLGKLIDPSLQMELNMEEANHVINVALLCIGSSPSSRPTMSAVVCMLEGQTSGVDVMPEQNMTSNDIEIEGSAKSYESPENDQTKRILIEGSANTSTMSRSDLYPVNLDSYYGSQR